MTKVCAPWYPTIFPEKCDGCLRFGEPRCIKFCPHGVYSFIDGKAVVANPQNCIYGCVACESVCPKKAILFPQRTPLGQSFRRDKCLLKRVKCEGCGKIFLTNKDTNLCLDCRRKLG
ncbi:MAG: ferredoxin family protein [Candidatus Bathyarchaeia archaeon]